MPNDENRDERITQVCDEQQKDYLRRSSINFLECAMHLCVTHMTIEEVAVLLEKEAAILREHG